MRTAIVTGSGGLIGSESVRHFVEAGYEVIGLENDMRARFFGADASTAHTTEELVRRYPQEFARWRSTYETPRVYRGSSPSLLGRSIWSSTPLRSHTRLGGVGSPNRLRRERQWHAQPPAGGEESCFERHLHLLLHEQGLRRRPEPDRPHGAGNTLGLRRPRLRERHLRELHGRPVAPFALRRLQGGGRHDGPGVRALLRDADVLPARGVPHRAEPLGRRAPRVPQLPGASAT